MGTYLIKTEQKEILAVIRQFVSEEGLGQPQIEYGDNSLLKVRASGSDSSCCFWICQKSSKGVVVNIRVLPTLSKMFQFYISVLLVAIGMSSIGCLLIIKDLAGMLHHINLFLVFGGIILIGLFLWWKGRHAEIRIANLSLERRFFEKLKLFSPLIMKIPEQYVLPFSVYLLMCVSFLLPLIGLIRAVPLFAIPMAYGFTIFVISITSIKHLKPHTKWRVELLGWINKWAIVFFMAFMGIVFFSFFNAAISCLHQGQQADESYFIEPIKNPVWRTPEELRHRNIFAANAECFKDLIAKNSFDKNRAVMIAQIARLVLICLSLALLIWGVQGFIDWIRTWMAVDPRTKPKLSPPPASIYGQSSHTSKIPILLTLLSGGIGNLLNLALTIEILSVLILGRAVFSYTIAQTICWIAIDFNAAASGSVQTSLVGVDFLIIIMLPTLITTTIWILVLACSQIGRLKRLLFPLKDHMLVEMVSKLSCRFELCPPTVYVVKSKKSFFTTIVPWLFGRPYLLISQVALKNLTKVDLESVIAHELAHVKYDRAVIRLMQWMSTLFWFPCNAFGLLIDTESREMRADKEAANIIGNNEAIASALVKICVNRLNFHTGNEMVTTSEKTGGIIGLLKKRWYDAVDYILLLRPLFWPEFVFGYAHPAVQDRLAAILANNIVLDTT